VVATGWPLHSRAPVRVQADVVPACHGGLHRFGQLLPLPADGRGVSARVALRQIQDTQGDPLSVRLFDGPQRVFAQACQALVAVAVRLVGQFPHSHLRHCPPARRHIAHKGRAALPPACQIAAVHVVCPDAPEDARHVGKRYVRRRIDHLHPAAAPLGKDAVHPGQYPLAVQRRQHLSPPPRHERQPLGVCVSRATRAYPVGVAVPQHGQRAVTGAQVAHQLPRRLQLSVRRRLCGEIAHHADGQAVGVRIARVVVAATRVPKEAILVVALVRLAIGVDQIVIGAAGIAFLSHMVGRNRRGRGVRWRGRVVYDDSLRPTTWPPSTVRW